MKTIILVVLLAQISWAQERAWTQIKVPNAQCGTGDPYSIFVSPGTDPGKISFAFEGGGACWSNDTCFGLIKYAHLNAHNKVDEAGGFFSRNPMKSPAFDTTMFYFPYCTGDVHAAHHTNNYGGKKVFHSGYNNIVQSLALIYGQFGDLLINAKQLIVYGYSAGAIGAIVHIRMIDQLFGFIPKKSAIFDSPGLHWGDDFWYKFTAPLISDYAESLGAAGATFDMNNGNIASTIPKLCRDLEYWNIGVIQSTKDQIMSVVFGDISMAKHEAKVLGQAGIYELTKTDDDNCSAWVPTSTVHSFLSKDKSSLPKAGGLTVQNYANLIVAGEHLKSYK